MALPHRRGGRAEGRARSCSTHPAALGRPGHASRFRRRPGGEPDTPSRALRQRPAARHRRPPRRGGRQRAAGSRDTLGAHVPVKAAAGSRMCTLKDPHHPRNRRHRERPLAGADHGHPADERRRWGRIGVAVELISRTPTSIPPRHSGRAPRPLARPAACHRRRHPRMRRRAGRTR